MVTLEDLASVLLVELKLCCRSLERWCCWSLAYFKNWLIFMMAPLAYIMGACFLSVMLS